MEKWQAANDVFQALGEIAWSEMSAERKNQLRLMDNINDCRAQGGLIQRGLASARALCPLPEYVPLISEEVQWKNNEVRRTSEDRRSGVEIRTGGVERRLGQEEWSED
ncbi:hypothetical protein BDR05DRAFT_945328 [Suillus weaverae]|nr:hypothetical protein BDR05DRAFT_945328 [Suillus weaverae]